MKTLAIVISAAILAGCSSFKLGAGCYIPHGVSGQCTAATIEPNKPPAAAPATPVKAPAAGPAATGA